MIIEIGSNIYDSLVSVASQYVSKEASLADWLAGFGTFLVAVIALLPTISSQFARKLLPKLELKISGWGNIVISSDGYVHKIQVPYQIENLSLSSGYIEEMQISIKLDKMGNSIDLPWRKFIRDVAGSATAPLSNPYRFKIESKSTTKKFIEFLTEETISFVEHNYELQTTAILSYQNKNKEIKITNTIRITKEIFNEIQKNSLLAKRDKAPALISIPMPTM